MNEMFIALDRLIYQTDTCRIYHYTNYEQDKAIRNVMSEFPLQKIWHLEYVVFAEDAPITEHNGYLIYHTR